MAGAPRRRWSQHFLTDNRLALRIVESMKPKAGDSVLEIGPGRGVLTSFLLNSQAGQIVAVEIDPELSAMLKEKYGNERFHLITEDFLAIDWKEQLRAGNWRVIGNLPYAITSPILFRLMECRQWIHDITVMVQREVADRLTGSPGTRTYGIPSVLFQAHSRVETLFHVSRGSFFPVPGVDSSVIRITFYRKPRYSIMNEVFFTEMVRAVFQQRRKMMRNTLATWMGIPDLDNKVRTDLSLRPEALGVSGLVDLSNELQDLKRSLSAGQSSG
ncbi:MAG TPA: ribosomal RNA small subunit methyltransferase A [bacterium]|nr:ribosomal RNA small subunit methyltransferase A [bacterium]